MKSPKDFIEEANIKRRKEDNVAELINKNGFHEVYGGRSGTIYYVKNGQLCEFYYEGGNGGIMIHLDDQTDWVLPIKQLMTEAEKNKIQQELLDWLDKEKIKATID
jgi:hypothetical protein